MDLLEITTTAPLSEPLLQVITKIAGIYAERLMSDVLLVVGDQVNIFTKEQEK